MAEQRGVPAPPGLSRPLDWEAEQRQLRIKNTFLDWPAPWMDPDHRRAFEESEAGRPKSDPTSSSSRSTSSSSVGSSSAGNGAMYVAGVVETIEGLMARGRFPPPPPPEPPPPVVYGPEHPDWTTGAAEHAEGTCTPCINFSNDQCKKGRTCFRCHLPHEKKVKEKKRRLRPPPRLKYEAIAREEAEKIGRNLDEDRAHFHLLLEGLMEKAYAEGDDFDIDKADYFPAFVIESVFLREQFARTLNLYKRARLPPPAPDPPPPAPTPAATTASSCAAVSSVDLRAAQLLANLSKPAARTTSKPATVRSISKPLKLKPIGDKDGCSEMETRTSSPMKARHSGVEDKDGYSSCGSSDMFSL